MSRPKVVYFTRKPIDAVSYSIESIFESLRLHLVSDIDATLHVAPVLSTGLIGRIRIIIAAWRKQGGINHVAGDITYVASFLRGNQTITTICDCIFLRHSKGIRRAVLKFFWLTLPVKTSRFVTTISEASKSDILKETNCSEEKVLVIPAAVSELYQYHPFEFNKQCPRILHVGTTINKNLDRLCEALQGIPCHLVVVGQLSDEQRDKLVDSRIEYTNHVGLPTKKLVDIYASCDLVAFVSTFEGFGMPIVEAQRVGRPLVTSNLSSMPEVAGNAACFVDPYSVSSIRDGILRIIQDTDYRHELIENGLKNAQRFSWERVSNSYLSLYRTVSGSSSESKGELLQAVAHTANGQSNAA